MLTTVFFEATLSHFLFLFFYFFHTCRSWEAAFWLALEAVSCLQSQTGFGVSGRRQRVSDMRWVPKFLSRGIQAGGTHFRVVSFRSCSLPDLGSACCIAEMSGSNWGAMCQGQKDCGSTNPKTTKKKWVI